MHPTQNTISGAPSELTPADVLRCAARYLQHYGWTQSTLYLDSDAEPAARVPFPCACALGAIGIAATGRRIDFTPDQMGSLAPGFLDEYRHAVRFLADFLDRNLNYHPRQDLLQALAEWDVWDWNDEPHQDAESV